MQKGENKSLKELIDVMLKAYKLENGLKEHNIRAAWGGIVGDHIAKHTLKVELKNKYLYVKLDNDVLRHELSYGKTLIIKKVNEFLGEEKIEKVILT